MLFFSCGFFCRDFIRSMINTKIIAGELKKKEKRKEFGIGSDKAELRINKYEVAAPLTYKDARGVMS